jgi:transcriptional regulator with XRE-family HTH domain
MMNLIMHSGPADTAADTLDAMDLPDRLRAGRRNKKMSQRALADALGVAPSAVAQWELGQTRPNFDNRVDLSVILDLPFADLLSEDEAPAALVSRDPDEIRLVTLFRRMPAGMRQATLMVVRSAIDLDHQSDPATRPATQAPTETRAAAGSAPSA